MAPVNISLVPLDLGSFHLLHWFVKVRNLKRSVLKIIFQINHSCYPNVKHITVDNKFVIVVTRPIKAGEQLFISYGYSFFRFTRKERYERLSRYKFKCECIACIEDYPKLEQLTKENPRFKEVEDATYSALSAIAQFKKNCAYIEKHIKEPPSYELMRLMCHNDHLLHGVARIDFDNIGIEL